ncbi:hypothetical protein RIF29_20737 [Crotalaria pallida]|uniref:Uncharacterized protein n=1 Tax=Crotalaria pallida TaxID=3830 RepID=A0AAN9FA93_CROPI
MKLDKEAPFKWMDLVVAKVPIATVMKKRSKKTKSKKKKEKKQRELIAWKDFWIDLRIDSKEKPMKDMVEGSSKESIFSSQIQSPNDNAISGPRFDNQASGSLIPGSQCNQLEEAQNLWKIGQQLGVTAHGNDSEIVERMVELEVRDREEKRSRSRKQNVDK